jgi:hypothetical protein
MEAISYVITNVTQPSAVGAPKAPASTH